MNAPSRPLGYIAGFDPGDSTGLFIIGLGNEKVQGVLATQGPFTKALIDLEVMIRHAHSEGLELLIACERYLVTPRTGIRSQQPTALQAIGGLKVLAEQHDVHIVMQPPGDAKAFAPNHRLKRLGLYTTPTQVKCPDANDVNDAARHALLTLVRSRPALFDAIFTATEVTP